MQYRNLKPPKSVIDIYVMNGCGACESLKRELVKNDRYMKKKYNLIDVRSIEGTPEYTHFKKHSQTVPATIYNGRVHRGMNEIMQLLTIYD
jgi:glutaredoxin